MSDAPGRGVAGLVLAAGHGRRFGSAKLLAQLRGRPLVAYALDVAGRARAAGLLCDLHVVIAPEADEVAGLAVQAGAGVIVNPTPDGGLSTSLRHGLKALAAAEAALVLLGDQPLVRLDVVAVLVAAWHHGLGRLIRPRYADAPSEPGHPVLADRSVWPLAHRLEGDAGFGALLPEGTPGLVLIDVAGRNPDVDTPADLHTLEGSST